MSKLIFAGAAALFVTVAAIGQAPPSPAPQSPGGWHGKNLKVLPADIPHDRLIGVMRGFTASLGVKCTFCHVGVDGQRETMDFPSDANPHKNVARRMMAMTRRLNEQDFAVTDLTQSKISCFTCHRGAEEPLLLPPPTVIPAPAVTPAR